MVALENGIGAHPARLSAPKPETIMRLSQLAIAAAPVLSACSSGAQALSAHATGCPASEPPAFLAVRMAFVVPAHGRNRNHGAREGSRMFAKWQHALVAGSLCPRAVSRWRIHRHQPGYPSRHFGLDPDLQPILTSTIANRFMGERVTGIQWFGLVLGLLGVVLVMHDRDIILAGSLLGWIASFLSLIGITLGTLYQKRYCGAIDWRTGNLVQYIGAAVLFALGAFAFETREIHWSGELIFALAWLVLVLSIAAVGLMYWLIRRSAATGFASLFYLVPAVTALFAFLLFGERLDGVSIFGMAICAGGVVLANRGRQSRKRCSGYFPRSSTS